ncbi:hypothetical protein HanRHA438_Chr01g0005921 [Helianthus annuus]|nr:hypothetical protein HanHA300_Chr01g0004411 [Helianthus annuus]KAJ0621203.1 hypothetical protein HanIR_Chr01g0006041 [Helianthus annuus]KAJ0625741.1 hypothetical protein HanHA89_Chr01g0005061 [Helianthus annuus]KAJ0782111.1 hypothetical protein HanLR1_Chr01g0004411 [Helianthus annuus]KAJ0803729.1 hypothetical protein HanLR1_Chr00c1705g0815991 [Helianthus annuus]
MISSYLINNEWIVIKKTLYFAAQILFVDCLVPLCFGNGELRFSSKPSFVVVILLLIIFWLDCLVLLGFPKFFGS